MSKYSKGTTWFKWNLRFSYFNLCFWALDLENRSAYRKLWENILRLYSTTSKRRNLRFAYMYLKDAYTLLQFIQAGQKYTNTKVWVAIDNKGIPKIIPSELRMIILDNRKVFTGVSTLLGVHRVIPWWPKVDLSTILDPFNGISEVLSPALIKVGWDALRTVLKKGFIIKPAYFLNLTSASPNGPVSVLSLVSDASAFWNYRGYLLTYIRYLLQTKSYTVLLIFIFFLVMSFPFRKDMLLGKLGTVYAVAGKARVIGITNFWIQVALKPLHDSLMRILKQLPTDGTYDQKGVLNELLLSGVTNLSSFDLSAATDRLPLEFQGQVLASLFGRKLSSLWVGMMRIPMLSKQGIIQYSVGQPMGAYSSWASLAISHHYLVWAANKGYTNRYCILGDDVVMDSKIGDHYQTLMKTLGVSISIPKSLINSTYAEFAKTLMNMNGEDYSILGPGAITASIQNPMLKSLLLFESFKRGFLDRSRVSNKLFSLRQISLWDFGFNQLFGPGGLIEHDPVIAPKGGKVGGMFMTRIPDNFAEFLTKGAFVQFLLNQHRRMVKESRYQIWFVPDYIIENCSFSGNALARVYHLALLLISPCLYILLSAYWVKGWKTPFDHGKVGTWDGIWDAMQAYQVSSLDKVTRADVKHINKVLNEIKSHLELSLQDISVEVGIDGTVHVY